MSQSGGPGALPPRAEVRELTLAQFLGRLAARVPAPGGGAVAALHAGQAAALLAKVARYSDGPAYAAHRPVIREVLAAAQTAREQALSYVEADVAAFSLVADAYQLPRKTPGEQATRSAAIATALAGAAEPPAAVVGLAGRLVALAEQLLPVGNPNVLTDVATAADSARAAATAARVNVEVNLAGIGDDVTRVRLATAVAGVDALAARAERVTAAVRARTSR